jgi:DNA-binding transcriptional LysR family regulator
MELRHLRYFVAVAEHLNFSRAAEALGTAQPSLSQQIRQLETEMDLELFTRERRQIALTAAGDVFLGEVRTLLGQLDLAVMHAREAARGLRGELRIAYTVSTMMTFLPSAIRAYRADQPNVRLTLTALANISTVEALRRREADIGVLVSHRDLSSVSGIEMRPIGSLPIGLVMPNGHRLAQRTSVALEEIENETLIVYARRLGDIYDVVLRLCHERGFVPARVEEVDRVETILGLVAAGEGVSIVPRLYETLEFSGITYTALEPAPEPFTMMAARSNDARSPLSTAFVETCERVGRAMGLALDPSVLDGGGKSR